MLNHFTFNGHSTGELGLLVSGINIYGSPSRIVEKVTIPYRSGDLIIDTGAYTNYMLTYTVDIMDNTKATAEAISKWLLGSKGYCELTDTYNPEIYRVASYYNQLDYTLSALYRYGKATITFDCKPQKYLTANQPVSLSSTLSEETTYSLSSPAMPLPITLEGNTTQGANPSPSSPQAIHSVSGDNTVTVCGFNLWNEQWRNGYYSANGTYYSTPSAYSNLANVNPIKVVPNTTYYIKAPNNSGNTLIWLDTNMNVVSANTNATFNTTVVAPPNAYYLNFKSNYGTATAPTYNNDICINVSDTAKNGTYEPYKAQVYPINLPVENLFNKADGEDNKNFDASGGLVSGTHFISNYISVLPNTTYYLSNVVSAYNGRSAFAYDSNKATPRVIIFSNTNATSGTFTTGSAEVYVRVCTDTPDICQLEVGSKANSYTPYGISPIELNALGNYKDYFHKTNGKWYLHKATAKITYNGSEHWAKASGSYNYYYVQNDSLLKLSNYNGAILCDKLPVYRIYPDMQNVTNGLSAWYENSYPNQNWFYAKANNITTLAEWETWLGSNPITIYYALATPTETEITDTTLISQLNALSKAKTYDGSTTIVQDGTDAQFKLSMPVPAEVTSEYKGEPIITVNEVGTIVWNDSLIKVNSAPVTINSQTLQCYYYSENKNNDVEINEFPKYEQGENYIGSTMALTVVPNYWKL